MDKYEFKIKVEKMKKAVDRKDYLTAAKVADSINWERSTNAKVLMMIAQIYEKQERYTEARSALTAVYNRVPVGKRIVYKLAELAVKCNDLDDALELYREYQEIAPNDPSKLTLAYKISTARGDALDKRISILEAYRRRDFDEKWAYELATLYQQAGRGADCVAICDEIILWFGVGPYVDRAMTLKVAYAPLTPEQEEKRAHKDYYEQRLAEVAAMSSDAVQFSPEAAISEDDESKADEADLTAKTCEPEDGAAQDDFPVDAPSVSPVVKEAELHMTMEQELAQAIQSTTDNMAPEADTNEWITDKPISVDRVGEDVDGQYTLFRTVAEECGDMRLPEHTRTFSFGALLTKTRRLDSLRDLAELNSSLEPHEDTHEAAPVPEAPVTVSALASVKRPSEIPAEELTEASVEAPAEDSTVTPAETPAEAPVEAPSEDLTEAPMETPSEDLTEVPVETPANAPTAAVLAEESEPKNQYMIFCHVLKLNNETPAVAQIKEALQLAHEVSGIPAASIARVGIDKINRAGLTAALEKLQGRDLLLENAGELSESVIGQLLSAVEEPPCTSVILLADDADGISQLYRKAPTLFPLSAKLPDETPGEEIGEVPMLSTGATAVTTEETIAQAVASSENAKAEPDADSVAAEQNRRSMTPDEFSAFIHEYALENDCKFDSMAELALAARIDRLELSGAPMDTEAAIALVERAIDKAERWTFKSIFISRYDKEGYLIIKETHIS